MASDLPLLRAHRPAERAASNAGIARPARPPRRAVLLAVRVVRAVDRHLRARAPSRLGATVLSYPLPSSLHPSIAEKRCRPRLTELVDVTTHIDADETRRDSRNEGSK